MTIALALGASFVAVPTWAQSGGATAPAGAAQSAGIQAALVNDVGKLSDKFVGLARVMAGKYDWEARRRRAVGRRGVQPDRRRKQDAGGTAGGRACPGCQAGPDVATDPAQMQEALRTSYAALRQALSGLSESDLNTSVKLFGRDTTKMGAALMLLMDQHEHLGQSIAYARSNRVVPPWSK